MLRIRLKSVLMTAAKAEAGGIALFLTGGRKAKISDDHNLAQA